MKEKLKVYRTIHYIGVAVGLLSIVLPIMFWSHIPDTIPMHYNAAGVVDSWSDKTSMILLFFVILMLTGMMSIVQYFIRSSGLSEHASPSEKKNLTTIYPMIVVMNLVMELMFAYIVFCIATGRELGAFFLPITLGCTFGPLVYYLVKYYKDGAPTEAQKEIYHSQEKERRGEGISYRTKVDWWLGLLLIVPIFVMLAVDAEQISKGKWDGTMIFVTVLVLAIVIPLFFIRYTLYKDYLLVSCAIFGKERIPYKSITKIQKTSNPLSSAALSIKRIQIDYTVNGAHRSVMISPPKRDEFIRELEKRR